MAHGDRTPARVSSACAARIPRYLRALRDLPPPGTISSAALAEAAGVSATILRKDLAALRITGTRGVGYDAADLQRRLAAAMGADGPAQLYLVGKATMLGAVAACPAFNDGSFTVAGQLPATDGRITEEGRTLLRRAVAEHPSTTVVLAVGADQASQSVADLAATGVRSIYSLTPVPGEPPRGVRVRTLDLASELTLAGRPPATAEAVAVP